MPEYDPIALRITFALIIISVIAVAGGIALAIVARRTEIEAVINERELKGK